MVDKTYLLKGSKVAMILFCLLTAGFLIAGGITSSEVDDVCANNEEFLQRNDGQWKCFKKSHAGMYNYSANTTAYSFVIGTAGVYYNLSGLGNSTLDGFNFSTDSENGSILTLESGADGHYSIAWSVSFESTVNDALYSAVAVKNGDKSISRECYSRAWARKTQVENVGDICTYDMIEGDNIRLQIENEVNNRDIKIHTAGVNILRIH